jgi:hypothetical protein
VNEEALDHWGRGGGWCVKNKTKMLSEIYFKLFDIHYSSPF